MSSRTRLVPVTRTQAAHWVKHLYKDEMDHLAKLNHGVIVPLKY